MSYEITQKFIAKNRSHKVLNAKGTVVHETASPGASDEAEFNYFNNGAGGRSASAHAFVDYDSITQTIPWDEQAWHAGGTANRNYIGIELCNYNDKDKFEEIWKRAVWLFAWVHVNEIKQTTINKETLMSHAEVSAKWHETDHTDPIAYFAKFGKTVDQFRAEVQSAINDMVAPGPEVNQKVKLIQELCNLLRCTDENGHALAVDGIVGTHTRAAVAKLPIIKLGSNNDNAIRVIQEIVGVKVDGDFGPNTLAAVKSWQKDNGLVADGIVGPNTWAKMIG